MGLLATTSVAVDGSKFKAVNNQDKNFKPTKRAAITSQEKCWRPPFRVL
jgi:hypothetical protein